MSRHTERSQKLRADLHIHYGDDVGMAHEIVREAAAKGIGLVALLAKQRSPKELVGLPEVEGVKVLPGMELVTAEPGRDGFVDIVAIGCDPHHDALSDWVGDDNKQRVINQRIERASRGLDYLTTSFDFTINQDNASENHRLRFEQLMGGSVQTIGLELGKLLFEMGQNKAAFAKLANEFPDDWEAALTKCCASHDTTEYVMKDGFKESTLYGDFVYKALYNRGRLFADKTHLKPSEGISRIHAAGGVALYSPEGSYDPSLMNELIAAGIDGVMGLHATKLGIKSTPSEGEDTIDIPFSELKKLIRKDLIIAGGSDFQGKDFKLGVGKGDMNYTLNEKRLRQLATRLEAHGSPYAAIISSNFTPIR